MSKDFALLGFQKEHICLLAILFLNGLVIKHDLRWIFRKYNLKNTAIVIFIFLIWVFLSNFAFCAIKNDNCM